LRGRRQKRGLLARVPQTAPPSFKGDLRFKIACRVERGMSIRAKCRLRCLVVRLTGAIMGGRLYLWCSTAPAGTARKRPGARRSGGTERFNRGTPGQLLKGPCAGWTRWPAAAIMEHGGARHGAEERGLPAAPKPVRRGHGYSLGEWDRRDVGGATGCARRVEGRWQESGGEGLSSAGGGGAPSRRRRCGGGWLEGKGAREV